MNQNLIITFRVAFILLFLISTTTFAQRPERHSAVDIYKGLEKLEVLGNVLYIAAHPDDENTRLITYLSKAKKVNTAYLSLTRGDGGQNSIGPEQSELLGIIRTQELMAARSVDGGQQFFTRAMDFGYSKSATEALSIWNRENLLFDMVWVIRNFKPDVMITRFPPDRRAGHGQHETSAILAAEAFDMAGDPNVFPEQLQYVETWQPTSLYLNTGRWWNPEISEGEGIISVDIGEYDPLSGLSYSELGADSRSQHKSQAFGVTWQRGESREYLEFTKGEKATSDVFENMDFTWNRIGREDISRDIEKIKNSFDFNDPAKSVASLLDLRDIINQIENEFWKQRKIHEVNELIKACLGLYIEVDSDRYYASPGDSVTFNFEVTNRSNIPVAVTSIGSKELDADTSLYTSLTYNGQLEFGWKQLITESVPESTPYWLNDPRKGFEYEINDLQQRGKPENDPPVHFDLSVAIGDRSISYKVPAVYTWTDRIQGQQYRPFEVGPAYFTEIQEPVLIFPDDNTKSISVKVTSNRDFNEGTLKLDLPKGWTSDPEQITISGRKDSEIFYEFSVTPAKQQQSVNIKAVAEIDGKKYDRSLYRVDYLHIPTQVVYLPSICKAVRIDMQKNGNKIGYIEGAGDEVAASLSQIGYDITIINESNIADLDLNMFDAVVVGIMAYNNYDYLEDYNEKLLQFVKEGGNLIYQYTNIRIGLKSDLAMPFPIEFSRNSSQVRVSVENAEVRFLAPEHPVLNAPNKISENDFEGWVQERGLYFPVSWDSNYTAVLSSNDPGEDPLNGGLLIAKYGDGYYIYSAYAWFRQLPAGVPGAYRIFANMISLGNGSPEN